MLGVKRTKSKLVSRLKTIIEIVGEKKLSSARKTITATALISGHNASDSATINTSTQVETCKTMVSQLLQTII